MRLMRARLPRRWKIYPEVSATIILGGVNFTVMTDQKLGKLNN